MSGLCSKTVEDREELLAETSYNVGVAVVVVVVASKSKTLLEWLK